MKKTMYLTGLLTLSTVLGASAQTSLWTTSDDFAQFSGAVTSSSYYSINSTLNGVGNTSNPGGTGTVGSLQLTTVNSGWGATASATYSGPTTATMLAFDPGYAYPSLPAASGTVSYDLYLGDLTGFWGINVWMQGGGYSWHSFNNTSSTDFTGADGRTWTHVVIPYTIDNATVSWFQIGFQEWGDVAGSGQTFYVDNIQVQAAPVPEPGTMAMAAVGGAALLFLRRRSVR